MILIKKANVLKNKGIRKKNINWYIDKQKIEQINNIKYLGYLINENNNNKHRRHTRRFSSTYRSRWLIRIPLDEKRRL